MATRDGIDSDLDVDGVGLTKNGKSETIAPMTFKVVVRLVRRGALRVVTTTKGNAVVAIVKIPVSG
jgi:hypothetical protein